MSLSDIRSRLNGLEGRTYWRSLEELADTPEFKDYVQREFPSQASEFTDPAGRRDFLKLMGASLALAGVSACTRQPEEKHRSLRPSARRRSFPAVLCFLRPRCPRAGSAIPYSLKTTWAGRRSSRATRITRPAWAPRTSSARPSVLDLYDPDRSRTILHRGEVKTWNAFLAAGRGDRQRPTGIARPVASHSDRADHVAVARGAD